MAEDKLAAIFAAALELFSSQGFDKTSVDEVAARAKVAKGTIFYHYRSKEELFNHMIQRGLDRLVGAVRADLAGESDPLEGLRKVVRMQTLMLYQHPEFFRLLLSEVWGSQERQRLLRAGLRPYFELLEDLAGRGVRTGQLRPISPSTVADIIFGMTSMAAYHLLLNPTPQPPDEVIAELQTALIFGIGA